MCISFHSATWEELGSGATGDISLYVPTKWTAQSCKDQAQKLGGTKFRLGCVFSDHASVGPFVSVLMRSYQALPPENCGW
jgi:hypothetical protein